MLRTLCFILLVGLGSVHLAKADPQVPARAEKIAIAKAAFEWLLLEDWPCREDHNAIAGDLEKSRKHLRASDAATFRINLVDSKREVELPLLYDRKLKTLVIITDPSPLWDLNTAWVMIERATNCWKVGIEDSPADVLSEIEVSQNGGIYYISKFLWSHIDCL